MFVDSTLAARLEAVQAWRAARYAQAALQRSPAPAGGVVTLNGAQLIYGGPQRPVNRAIGLGMAGPVTAADLDAVEDFFAARNAPVLVDLCPLADPTLVELLAARRYAVMRHTTVLVLALPATLPPREPVAGADVVVTLAAPADADLWLDTSARGFDGTDTPAPQTLTILTPNFYSAQARCYFAWLDGAPVGTGGLYDHGGVAELGGASTLVTQRRRGVQTALIARRLADAYTLGCDVALVITTPGTTSQHNMQRLGFAVAYTKTVLARTAG